MPIIVIGGLLGLAFLAIWLGFVPPPHASTLIWIREGMVHILREAGVSKGYIAITPENWVAFSRHIPPRIHQRLRNVLLNQWA